MSGTGHGLESISDSITEWRELESKRMESVDTARLIRRRQSKIEAVFREYLNENDADELDLGEGKYFARCEKEVLRLTKEDVQRAVGDERYGQMVQENTVNKVVLVTKKRKTGAERYVPEMQS